MISKFSLLSLVLALAVLPLWAQDNAPSPRYFRTVGAGVSATDLYFSLNGKDKNISISDGFRSILYNGKGTGLVVFYTISQGPDGKQIDTPVAQADISQAGSLALLTFSHDPRAPGKYQVAALADDLATFPLGSYRVVNRSRLRVKVVLGQQSTDVAPNEVRLVVYPPPENDPAVPARVYTPGNNNERLAYADTWTYNPKFRTEILISPREGTENFVDVSRMLDNPTVLLSKANLPKD